MSLHAIKGSSEAFPDNNMSKSDISRRVYFGCLAGRICPLLSTLKTTCEAGPGWSPPYLPLLFGRKNLLNGDLEHSGDLKSER